jgi:hypothetical protein
VGSNPGRVWALDHHRRLPLHCVSIGADMDTAGLDSCQEQPFLATKALKAAGETATMAPPAVRDEPKAPTQKISGLILLSALSPIHKAKRTALRKPGPHSLLFPTLASCST